MQPLTPVQVVQIKRIATYARDNMSFVYGPPHSDYNTHSIKDRLDQYSQFITDLNDVLEHMDILNDEYLEIAEGLSVSITQTPHESTSTETEE
jgi:hypothetical protein